MIAIRCLGLAAALVLLSACDPVEPTPPKSPPVPAVPAVSAPSEAPEVVPEPPPAKVEKPAKPLLKQAPTPVAAVVAPKPRPAATVSQAAKEPLPKATLDLRLPEEVVKEMQLDESVDEAISKSLLPPLFVEKPSGQSPFQLNGRLLTNDREDDYWRSVEGAELQFEFKQ